MKETQEENIKILARIAIVLTLLAFNLQVSDFKDSASPARMLYQLQLIRPKLHTNIFSMFPRASSFYRMEKVNE